MNADSMDKHPDYAIIRFKSGYLKGTTATVRAGWGAYAHDPHWELESGVIWECECKEMEEILQIKSEDLYISAVILDPVNDLARELAELYDAEVIQRRVFPPTAKSDDSDLGMVFY